MEIIDAGFIFSDDPQKIDIAAVHHFLSSSSAWAKEIPFATVEKSIQHSLCFGIYKDKQQIGFARWVTDRATFAYLADVYVLAPYRGLGLSKKLLSFMLFHEDLQGLRRYMLATADAHSLYAQFGFKPIEDPTKLMAISVKNTHQ